MKTLVVEDDVTCRIILIELLEQYGRVDTVCNGKDAIALFDLALKNDSPYDVVCLDIMMPGMDGHEVLLNIRALESERNIYELDGATVFMITALGDSENVMSAFKEECDGYLVKPVSQPKLLDLLRQAELIPLEGGEDENGK